MRIGTGALALLAAASLLSACTSKDGANTKDVTNTRTVTHTRTPSVPTVTTKPETTVAPLLPDAAPAKGEVEKACPYILSSQDQGPNSMADLEGDRVYRTTVLTTMKPVGCRFYFWAGPYEAIAEIATQQYPDPRTARAAMIATAKVDPGAQGYPSLLPNIDAISYRTKFFGPDGNRDWACVFVKGSLLVKIRTQRSDTSLNARLIAKAIAPKI
ncbi:MAG TPA: hypothetical protein VJ831_14910 [Jatrophihabitantaceae bacterium]|nr:hypothetical protein [Jatrophihabitantaceae bacterium]